MTKTKSFQGLFVVAAAAIGLAVLWWLGNSASPAGADYQRKAQARSQQDENGTLLSSVAWRYALAVRDNNCAEVIRMTLWMNERLDGVRAAHGDSEELEAAWKALCRRISLRAIEGNQLTAEGVEDPYIFAPGVDLELMGVDKGAAGLKRPVAERSWIKVTYPDQGRALRDDEGRPIRSIVVGINVSQDGYILKAGVIGNLEVDRESIHYSWPGPEGG
ncbi:MAG: hypothetical protein ACLFU6_09190 [Candidatus Hydrogenedentota bacterium]